MRVRMVQSPGIGWVASVSAMLACMAAPAPVTAHAASPDACEVEAGALAVHRIGDLRVALHQRPDADGERSIEVRQYRPQAACQAQVIGRYEIEGGAPRLEADFLHPIKGQTNLITIVSWPLQHVGLGMQGRYYAAHAYRPTADGLAVNTFFTDNPALHSGVVGVVDGVEQHFEGSTQRGLLALMAAQGAWTWQADCDPDGHQQALNACAFAELAEAEAGLVALRAALDAEVLASFDAMQAAWSERLQAELDALFPLQPGESPQVAYGSSYPMAHARARALLLRQRLEFLRAHWPPAFMAAEPRTP